jgi:hypothetical protein
MAMEGNPDYTGDHNPWVNRYAAIRNGGGITADSYYQPICLCGWCGQTHDDPEKAHEEGLEHEVSNLPPMPDHHTNVNMGVQWLNQDGAKRIVYTALCCCGWIVDSTTDHAEAVILAAEHEADPQPLED